MPKIYHTLDLAEAVLLKDHLLHNGIAADIKSRGAVRIPYAGIASEVWVADDVHVDRARRLIREFLERRKEAPVDTQHPGDARSAAKKAPAHSKSAGTVAKLEPPEE